MTCKLGYAVVNRASLIRQCEETIARITVSQKEAGEEYVQHMYLEDLANYRKYWRWFWWLGFKEPTLESTRKKIAECVLLSFSQHVYQAVGDHYKEICEKTLYVAKRLSRDEIEVSFAVLNACDFEE